MGLTRRSLLACSAALAAVAFGGANAKALSTKLDLKRGINLFPWFSLTREFPAPRRDYDWPPFQEDRPVPTPTDLEALKRIGLDFVRIPVDPGPFAAADKSHRSALLRDLVSAVRECVNAGLSVVVNIQANTATHYWTPERFLSSITSSGFSIYRSLIQTLAGLLAQFPADRVALEPVNEPFQACSSTDWPAIQIALLTAARKSAPELTLVATGSCGSMTEGLLAIDPASLSSLQPLLYTFHFYEPYVFSHQGAPWMSEPIYRWLNQVPWPGSAGSFETTIAAVHARMDADMVTPPEQKPLILKEVEKALRDYFDGLPDRAYLENFLKPVAEWRDGHGLPKNSVFMGEFGALRSDRQYVASAREDRARYIRDVREAAESWGFGWAMWDIFDGMGIMSDDATRAFDPEILQSLGLNGR